VLGQVVVHVEGGGFGARVEERHDDGHFGGDGVVDLRLWADLGWIDGFERGASK
jgi:hypothetical protein